MIDLEKAKNEFMIYTNNYDMNEENINLKINHSYRVMDICKGIAEGLNFVDEDKKLAEIIGLLHDIGRFEQYTRYKTFNDLESTDHANLGVQILTEKDFIRNFIEDSNYDNLIIKAIYNHNKLEIEKGLNEKEKLFCKIIRDADKIDILYDTVDFFFKDNKDEINKGIISDDVYNSVLELKLVERKKDIKRTELDKLIVHIAFVFDLNFTESFKIIKKNNYIDKILDRFYFKIIETKKKIEQIRKISNNYIEERLKY